MTVDPEPYRIDYAAVDASAVMTQVRARARRLGAARAQSPAAAQGDLLEHLRDHLVLDDVRPYELQEALRLVGPWNVAPEDLRTSHPGALGSVISWVRSLARPLLKVVVNTDLPLHKQFKVNLGVASLLHELMQRNATLEQRVTELTARLESLETERDRTSG